MIGFTSLDKREERTLLKYLQMNASDTAGKAHGDKKEEKIMNNNDLFQASRRRFLAQLGGLTVAGMLGPSLLTPREIATAAQAATEAVTPKEGILTGSHWGLSARRWRRVALWRQKPFELDKYPSKMIAGLPDHVHNAARIRYPMVRVDWLRKRHLSDTSQRGDNRFCARELG